MLRLCGYRILSVSNICWLIGSRGRFLLVNLVSALTNKSCSECNWDVAQNHQASWWAKYPASNSNWPQERTKMQNLPQRQHSTAYSQGAIISPKSTHRRYIYWPKWCDKRSSPCKRWRDTWSAPWLDPLCSTKWEKGVVDGHGNIETHHHQGCKIVDREMMGDGAHDYPT